MTPKLSTIAKVLQRQSPEEYRKALKVCEPMLKRTDLIPAIYSKMKDLYPDQDRTDDSIIFTMCVYEAYAPATFIGQGIDRAPNGIRTPMCEIMQWKDEPTVNYYQDLGRVYQKVPSYKAKVSAILVGFQQFSVKSQQIELF